MNKRELIEEHKRLIRVLKKGDKKELKKEARIQERELKIYQMKKMDYCPAKCRRRTPHVKYGGYKLCKICGYQEKY